MEFAGYIIIKDGEEYEVTKGEYKRWNGEKYIMNSDILNFKKYTTMILLSGGRAI